ncbi:MAG: ATP-dependent Clp protease proteolytic subunit [Planctomycetota bacterium]
MRVPLAYLVAGVAMLIAASVAFAQTTRPATMPAEGAEVEGGKTAAVIIADGMVDNFFRDGILRRLQMAEAEGVDAVILSINTYGGLVTAGLETSRAIKQSPLPIYAYVDDKAISAGSMIALSAKAIAMEPASQIGDSGVIAMGQPLEGTERAKAESPVLADFDDSARRNGYDPLLARSFVRTDVVVYALQPTDGGEIRFVDGDEYETLISDDGGFVDVPDVPVPLDDEESLLTLGDDASARIGLSLGTYDTATAFAESLGYTVVATYSPSGGERAIGFLSSFAVRGLLTTVLLLSIYASFNAPGTGVPEVIAICTLGVLFGVPFLTGFAEWYEVALFLVGLGLLAVEVFLLPGFGMFGGTGLVLIITGLGLSFVGPIYVPDMPVGFGVDWGRFGEATLMLLICVAVSLFLWMWLARFLPSLPFGNDLLLKDEPPTPEEEARRLDWPTVGSVGTAVSDLRPGGVARFAITEAPGDTTTADVVSDRGFVAAGAELSVVEVAGSRVVVRPTTRREEG